MKGNWILFLLLMLFFIPSGNVSACENSSIGLVSHTDNGSSHDYVVEICVGGGVLGATSGADGPTETFSVGLRSLNDAALTITNATASVTSISTAVTMNAVVHGARGAPFNNEGNIRYQHPGGTDFACISSTAICGEPISDCFNITFRTDVELEEITAYGIEGNGNLFGGCTGEPDMTINLAALPVELSEFTARAEAGTVQLHWATTMEINNEFFEIERSVNGKDFQSVGQVAGQNTTDQLTQYFFEDNTAADGVYYYRLRQQDYAGVYTYSPIVAVVVEGSFGAEVRLYPNPVVDQLYIRTSRTVSAPVVTVKVFDAFGRLVHERAVDWNPEIVLSTKDYQAGMYMVYLYAEERLLTQKRFVKG